MTLSVQFLTMGWMLACGFLIGFAFDLYRVLAGELRLPRLLLPLFDLLYWALCTLLVFRVLFHANYGEVRIFVFIGLITGALFYFTFFSRTAIGVIRWLIEAVKRLVRLLIRVVDTVIITPIRGLIRLVTILLGFLYAVAIFLLKIVLQLLYPVRILGRALYRFLKRRLRMPGWLTVWWSRIRGWFRR